jgi:hypothetical protein
VVVFYFAQYHIGANSFVQEAIISFSLPFVSNERGFGSPPRRNTCPANLPHTHTHKNTMMMFFKLTKVVSFIVALLVVSTLVSGGDAASSTTLAVATDPLAVEDGSAKVAGPPPPQPPSGEQQSRLRANNNNNLSPSIATRALDALLLFRGSSPSSARATVAAPTDEVDAVTTTSTTQPEQRRHLYDCTWIFKCRTTCSMYPTYEACIRAHPACAGYRTYYYGC